MEIPINRKGRITKGKYSGWQVTVVETEPEQLHFLVLIDNPNKSESYDDWVEKREFLPEFFEHRDWGVVWESETD